MQAEKVTADHVEDPRQRRSREALFAALDKLLAEKPYAEISVTELCGRAGVGRQTFYRHFDGIDAMLRDRLDASLAGQIEAATAAATAMPGDWLRQIALFAFEQVRQRPRASRLILSGAAGADALDLFRSQIMALWAAAPANDALAAIPAELQPYVASFHAGAICAVLLHWIDNDCSPDAEAMSRLVASLSRPAK
ncbi:MAG: TetR/AcrR family transcriptional regulator [Rhodoblastus sp.]